MASLTSLERVSVLLLLILACGSSKVHDSSYIILQRSLMQYQPDLGIPEFRNENDDKVAVWDETLYPTNNPSLEPTVQPTLEPTATPTSTPTPVPTVQPSMTPSHTPSQNPSRRPSNMPSHAPSHMPSSTPSQNPSRTPSNMPSHPPSHMPSSTPSRIPSHTPTHVPSDMPSDMPSDAPSEMPSMSPSLAPFVPDLPPPQEPRNVARVPADDPDNEEKSWLWAVLGLVGGTGIIIGVAAFSRIKRSAVAEAATTTVAGLTVANIGAAAAPTAVESLFVTDIEC